ncbi:MAG TPA: non-heme iron oxygenase ferredoxin subunit [Burkholderiales bacterium]|nr:non-heme iron oxygenase ferredoxin subunit [Burkholderiales bacterium]
MSDWANVAKTEAFGAGKAMLVEIEGAQIAVYKLDDGFHAIEDICTHDGGELASGCVEGDEVICPRHGARFSIRTGEALTAPAYEPVYKFPVRVEGGVVQVRDDRWD